MDILYKKTIELNNGFAFIAVGKTCENQYCIFRNEFSKLSNFSIWFHQATDKILREENPNLFYKNLEDSMRLCSNKILESNDAKSKNVYKEILDILIKEELCLKIKKK